MNTYTFKRGKFGMYNVPMWAGETRAFKLIRMLRKQGIKKIRYHEGTLTPFGIKDHVKRIMHHWAWTNYDMYQNPRIVWNSRMLQHLDIHNLGKAPHQFIVSWEN